MNSYIFKVQNFQVTFDLLFFYSPVISRVKDFLPKIHKSNTLINNALCGADAEEAAKRLDIEHLDSDLDQLIEMVKKSSLQ